MHKSIYEFISKLMLVLLTSGLQTLSVHAQVVAPGNLQDPPNASNGAVGSNGHERCASLTDHEQRHFCVRRAHIKRPQMDCAAHDIPHVRAHCEQQLASLNTCFDSRTDGELEACNQTQRALRAQHAPPAKGKPPATKP